MSSDKVTLKDVYAVVNRLEDKVDSNLAEQGSRLDDMEKKVSNIEGRNAIITIVFSGIVSAVMYNIRALIGK